MTLSEAIRLGSLLRPQVVGYWFRDGGSCAIGAAIEAVGACQYEHTPYPSYDGTKVPASWKWTRQRTTCPASCGAYDEVQGHLRHLNNDHRWTREQIADWVSTIEPKEVPATAVEHADACVAVARTQNVP